MTADQWTAIFTGITALFTAMLAVTAVKALAYARRQLSEARESDRIRHLLAFVEQFDSPPFSSIRKSLAQQRLAGVEYPPELDNILNFFETIGLLVKRGYLDAHDVRSCFSYWMFSVFADFRDHIEQEQKIDETYYADFMILVEKLRDIEKAEHGLSGRPSTDDVQEFWQYELDLTAGGSAAKRKPRKLPRRTADHG